MIALTRFRTDEPEFADRARAALAALAVRPGYVRGTLARATDETDEPADWLLLTEWVNVGAYRRALGGYDVKLAATPLLADALPGPGGYEPLLDVAPGGAVAEHVSDRAPWDATT